MRHRGGLLMPVRSPQLFAGICEYCQVIGQPGFRKASTQLETDSGILAGVQWLVACFLDHCPVTVPLEANTISFGRPNQLLTSMGIWFGVGRLAALPKIF
jgi:hypothetical protein